MSLCKKKLLVVKKISNYKHRLVKNQNQQRGFNYLGYFKLTIKKKKLE